MEDYLTTKTIEKIDETIKQKEFEIQILNNIKDSPEQFIPKMLNSDKMFYNKE